MYNEADRIEIGGRIRKYVIITVVLMLIWAGLFVIGIRVGIEWLTLAAASGFFCAICFMLVAFLLPCIRYRRFLYDMENGLSRELDGTIVEISEKEELQDGVRVLTVRFLLREEQDERFVYLNVSKAELFPKAGTDVKLKCFGRHIREFAES